MDRGMWDGVMIGLGICLLGSYLLSQEFLLLGWIPLFMGAAVVASSVVLRLMARGS
jgi:ABC-type multidrug transport system permease subunit